MHVLSGHESNYLKEYKCDSCGREFSVVGDMMRHMNSVHNGQKDHKCESCGKSFSRSGNLKNHIRSMHNGL